MDFPHRLRRLVSAVSVAALLTLGAAPALAQQNSNGSSGVPISSTTTVIVGVTVVGGGIALMLILLNGGDESGDSESKAAYIRNHATALQQALTTGHGAALQELAATYRIDASDREAFADLLHERRETLMPLTDRERLTPERADAFFRTIAEGMRAHPALRDDWNELKRLDG